MMKAIRERLDARLRSNGPPIPDSPRPRAIRAAWVAALVTGGGLLCWAAFLVEQRLSAPATPPEWRDVTFVVVVSDAVTGNAVPGAQEGTDVETGQIDPPGPTWKGITDAGGAIRLVEGFRANTVVGKDGKVRGRVVFHDGTPPASLSHRLVVRASGYREQTIDLGGEVDFPKASLSRTGPRKFGLHQILVEPVGSEYDDLFQGSALGRRCFTWSIILDLVLVSVYFQSIH